MDSHLSLALSLVLPLILVIPGRQANTFAQPLSTDSLAKSTRKLTKLQFYFHDKPNGRNPTSVIIARPSKQTTIGFGTLVMMDDPLTETPEVGSRLVGRAQGMYAESSVSGSGNLLMCCTFTFTLGKYNGSTISVLGRYPVVLPQREMPIVGGTGIFRFATGYVLANTYSYNPKTGLAISEYNSFVWHFDNPSV